MSEASHRALRGGVRALTGVVIIGVAATATVLLGAAPLPGIEREPVALTVDARHGAQRLFVCPGSFAELGADPQRPSVALPRGTAVVTTAGDAGDRLSELEREEPGGSAPEVHRVPAGESFAAAQRQEVVTDTLRGLVAASCAEPANEQWLVGGATTLGASTTVNLGNPSEVPATVQLSVYDENGKVDSALTSGVLVPAGSERIVSLNGYAPSRARLVVRVESTGAAVAASLGIGHVDGLLPLAVDTVTRQLGPDTRLVVPGVANLSEGEQGPGDRGGLDESPVVVRALSTTGEAGTATVRALLGDGASEDLGTIDLAGSAVGELSVERWPEAAMAVVVDADVPIVGGVLGSASSAQGQRDYAWFAPAPELPAQSEIPAAVSGQLVLVNPGADAATVRVSGAGVTEQSYTVPAGGAVAVQAPADARLTSSAPIHAGVRMAGGGDIAGYPVLAETLRAESLTVYPR